MTAEADGKACSGASMTAEADEKACSGASMTAEADGNSGRLRDKN